MIPLVLTMPDERPLSWNAFYAGGHWSKRKAEKDRVWLVVRSAFPAEVVDGFGWPVTERVKIEVTAYVKSSPMDADNVCTKLYVDALKGWVIPDDDGKWVETVIPRVKIDKANPRLEIRIELSDNDSHS
jgi:Holliday junction resolvase RusA-like endonuclease